MARGGLVFSHGRQRGSEIAMKINERELLNFINEKSWRIPVLIAALATPFMVLAITSSDEGLDTFAKLVWLILLLIFLAYNLLDRYLRKKFEGNSRN
jgi:hypothetical protein